MDNKEVKYYAMYDPIHDMLLRVNNFDQSYLKQEANRGAVFYAYYEDGTSEEISVESIKEVRVIAQKNELAFVQPNYVDQRIEALFDLIESFIEPLTLFLPSSYKTKIRDRFNQLEQLVKTGSIKNENEE